MSTLHNKISKETILQAVDVSKQYGAFPALSNVDFSLEKGEVHALFGENGAGKSTLISILSGAIRPSSGTLFFQGEEIRLTSVKEARNLGISAVFQEFSLVPQMTVAENIFLGEEPIRAGFVDKKQLVSRSNKILENLDFALDPTHKVANFSRAEQQMVEIAKAFSSPVSVLILDEPTASLTEHEANKLFETIQTLTNQGVGIIYITHRIAEIEKISNRVSVMRDGHYIGTIDNSHEKMDEEKIVSLITGKNHSNIYPLLSKPAKNVVFEAVNVSTNDNAVTSSSMHVYKGEIVGLAGLEGSGKSHFGQACYGAKETRAGNIIIDGINITKFPLKKKMEAGLIYLPADRKSAGLMLLRTAQENIALVSHVLHKGMLIDARQEKNTARVAADHLQITPNRLFMLAAQFSGGNQQKIMLARILATCFKVVILDEPTVGVDVGARAVIYQLIVQLATQGVSIIIISSDLTEILKLSHRVYVFNKGGIKKELVGKEITEEKVLNYFFRS